MKKISKAHSEQLDKLAFELEVASKGVIDAFNEVNTLIRETLNPNIAAFNESLTEFCEMRDDIVSSIDGYLDSRSEKWRESDKGDAVMSWKSAWEEYGADDIETVDELPELELDHYHTMVELPAAPDLPE